MELAKALSDGFQTNLIKTTCIIGSSMVKVVFLYQHAIRNQTR